jgi:phosphoglycerate dehydrogenase-like enzyme
MKRGAIFYNIGQGTTVDQQTLLETCDPTISAQRGSNVTDPEPLPDDHPFGGPPNCYNTPHTAGGDRNESETLVRSWITSTAFSAICRFAIGLGSFQ